MWLAPFATKTKPVRRTKEGHSRWLVAKRMERIEYKVLVMSNKGGWERAPAWSNLAVSLALKGLARGYLRHGYPWSQYPKMVGAEGQKLKISTSGGIIPFQAYNMKIASMSFLLQNSDDPDHLAGRLQV